MKQFDTVRYDEFGESREGVPLGDVTRQTQRSGRTPLQTQHLKPNTHVTAMAPQAPGSTRPRRWSERPRKDCSLYLDRQLAGQRRFALFRLYPPGSPGRRRQIFIENPANRFIRLRQNVSGSRFVFLFPQEGPERNESGPPDLRNSIRPAPLSLGGWNRKTNHVSFTGGTLNGVFCADRIFAPSGCTEMTPFTLNRLRPKAEGHLFQKRCPSRDP